MAGRRARSADGMTAREEIPEEVAYRTKLIDLAQLATLAEEVSNSDYGRYLVHLVEEERLLLP